MRRPVNRQDWSQPFFVQLLLEIVAGDEYHIGHFGEFRRLHAFGHPLIQHLNALIAMYVLARQQRTVETGSVGFGQLAYRVPRR